MKVKQFQFTYPGVGDVFGYLLFDPESGEAAAVDGGDPEAILEFINKESLSLKIITNTHCHSDHTGGEHKLKEAAGAVYFSPLELADRGSFDLGNETVEVLSTPGHSDDSVVFYSEPIILTGDTLFTGTIGNCYTEDYKTYFNSLKKLTALPGHCRIYSGHNLRGYAMGVAKKLNPENPGIDSYLSQLNPDDEWSLLAEELEVNPFIRWNDPALDAIRSRTGMPLDTEYQRFRAMMTLH